MRKFIIVLLFFVVAIVLVMLSDPFKTRLKESDVTYYTASKIEDAVVRDSLLVMTWNIKFGGARIDFFFDCFGKRSLMKMEEVLKNMEELAEFINATKPDILFVQEVDIDSKRSANINQVQWLLDNTHLNYAVYAPQWKASLVPSDSLGRMNSGIAILSRWPLSDAKRIALPLISEQNFIVRYFYLKRCLLESEVTINGQKLTLLTTHTEPYAKDGTKKKQLDQIHAHLQSLNSFGKTFIVAGDLNALPPGTLKTKGFPDSVCPDAEFDADDLSEEKHWMDGFYNSFNPAVPLMEYQADNARFFTHTVDGRGYWNRKLDYIFTNGAFVSDSHITYQSVDNGGYYTMPLSDHCALSVQFVNPK
jgi:endonuclease/exonuclease/phosphatase family metal-dependent hydrolase